MMKNNLIYKYSHIFLAVVCATAFFIHEIVPEVPESYIEAMESFHKEKNKKSALLKDFKEAYKQSPEYKAYNKQKIISDEAFNKFENVVEEISFLGFEDFQQFLGEFGWSFGLFIYSLFNFVNTYREPNRARKGKLILHVTLLVISLYFIYWALYKYQDFEKITYLVFSIITSFAIAISVHLILLKRYIQNKSYQLNHQDLIGFILNNTKPESEHDMWEVLKKIKHERV
ncbi:hypothetical protein U8527_03090 [Kordia algicida OT-1]